MSDALHTPQDIPNLCLHELVEAQAARSPEAVAVLFEDQQIGYAELNRRANQLARRLREAGVGRETLVGVLHERSIDMIVALLAVLKAGGAYLPLDPAHPAERLALILEDSRAAVLLTQTKFREQFGRAGLGTVCPDAERAALAGLPDGNLDAGGLPGQLAYIIYTSGSTGRPKGVQVSHRSVVNFLESMRRAPGIGPDDALLAVTTLSFDIAGLELWLPLTAGARVVLANRETATNPEQLSGLLASSGATIMQATPATWQMLLAAGWQGQAQLTALVGGEALPRSLAAQLLPRCAALWNMYGPTETTIWSTILRVAPEESSPVPIGGPIANTEIVLLDEQLRPVPAGELGRLFIGGDGLARGYHGRPDLTAERFVPHASGARLYDTGDLARQRPDGVLEYVGRADFQVKVRGFRVELGEIEAALEALPQVRQAVAVARPDATGTNRIVAYLVPAAQPAPQPGELRAALRQRLPDYMLPAFFVALEALPQTPNGKIDRKALPDPDTARAGRVASEDLPASALEQEVAGIWQNISGMVIGRRDNFLEVGGHSLLITQLVARVRTTFEISITLKEVLQRGLTIAGLVEIIENALLAQAEDGELEALLEQIDGLSDDQIQDVLAQS